MIALLLAAALAQATPCAEGADAIRRATGRAAAFDLPGAIARLVPSSAGCVDVEVSVLYLRGLIAAREAYRAGGSPESLAPVQAAVVELGTRSAATSGAEIARVVLLAASAAAQSEREEMALLLEHALALEVRQRASGGPGAPVVSAHEIAGDLWLQVHRFEDARLAYATAAREIGPGARITIGLARTAFRLGDVAAACANYKTLVTGWVRSAGEPTELAEAREFLRRPECRTGPAQPSGR